MAREFRLFPRFPFYQATSARIMEGAAADIFATEFFPKTLSLTAGTGSFLLTGVAASFPLTRRLTANVGTYSLTGISVALPVLRRSTEGTGTFLFDGINALLRVTRRMGSGTGSFAFTGQAAGFATTRRLGAATAAYSLTGIDVAFDVIEGGPTITVVDSGLLTRTFAAAARGNFAGPARVTFSADQRGQFR